MGEDVSAADPFAFEWKYALSQQGNNIFQGENVFCVPVIPAQSVPE
jgi:hypothetical protein